MAIVEVALVPRVAGEGVAGEADADEIASDAEVELRLDEEPNELLADGVRLEKDEVAALWEADADDEISTVEEDGKTPAEVDASVMDETDLFSNDGTKDQNRTSCVNNQLTDEVTCACEAVDELVVVQVEVVFMLQRRF